MHALKLDQGSRLNQGTGSGDPGHGRTRARAMAHTAEPMTHCCEDCTRPGHGYSCRRALDIGSLHGTGRRRHRPGLMGSSGCGSAGAAKSDSDGCNLGSARARLLEA